MEYIVKKTGNFMKQKLVFGTLLLTGSGLICRLIGFLYRVFLSNTIGAEGMGIYQLILPIYYLSYAITTAGIQTAISRLVAASVAKKKHTQAMMIFLTGTGISFALSLFIGILIRSNAEFLGAHILADIRCIPLLNILTLALPFGALHGCITGWFMGQNQVQLPAGIQILEETVRLITTYICYLFFLKRGLPATPSISLFGLLFGELISVLFSLFFILNHAMPHHHFPALSFYLTSIKKLFANAFPLTINRVALNLLHSIEAVLIPLSLQKWNPDQSGALETLGIVSGMALPLVLFPTAIINALSSVLLPAVSEKQALQDRSAITILVRKTTSYAVGIGVICLIFFSIFGNSLGLLFYKNADAGHYISILALISPFLFVNIILASVMNGLGKTYLCFLVNFVNMCIRVTCIYFLIPQIGIYGYLAGLIGGEIFCTILSIIIVAYLNLKKRSFL